MRSLEISPKKCTQHQPGALGPTSRRLCQPFPQVPMPKLELRRRRCGMAAKMVSENSSHSQPLVQSLLVHEFSPLPAPHNRNKHTTRRTGYVQTADRSLDTGAWHTAGTQQLLTNVTSASMKWNNSNGEEKHHICKSSGHRRTCSGNSRYLG